MPDFSVGQGYRLLAGVNEFTEQKTDIYKSKADAYAEKIVKQENLTKGCPLPNYAFSYQVPQQLNDPASFKPIKVYWGTKSNNGTQNVYMDYRVKNGFGGIFSGRAAGVVDLISCDFRLISV